MLLPPYIFLRRITFSHFFRYVEHGSLGIISRRPRYVAPSSPRYATHMNLDGLLAPPFQFLPPLLSCVRRGACMRPCKIPATCWAFNTGSTSTINTGAWPLSCLGLWSTWWCALEKYTEGVTKMTTKQFKWSGPKRPVSGSFMEIFMSNNFHATSLFLLIWQGFMRRERMEFHPMKHCRHDYQVCNLSNTAMKLCIETDQRAE